MMESMEVYVLLEGKKNPMLISLDKNEKVSDFIKKIVQTYPASLGKIDQDEILLQFENVDFSKPKTQVKTLDLSKNNENNPIIIKAPPQTPEQQKEKNLIVTLAKEAYVRFLVEVISEVYEKVPELHEIEGNSWQEQSKNKRIKEWLSESSNYS